MNCVCVRPLEAINVKSHRFCFNWYNILDIFWFGLHLWNSLITHSLWWSILLKMAPKLFLFSPFTWLFPQRLMGCKIGWLYPHSIRLCWHTVNVHISVFLMYWCHTKWIVPQALSVEFVLWKLGVIDCFIHQHLHPLSLFFSNIDAVHLWNCRNLCNPSNCSNPTQ